MSGEFIVGIKLQSEDFTGERKRTNLHDYKRINDRCPKCGIWERPEPRDQHLMIGHFINCLKRLHHNLYQVTLTGGEPLLFKKDVMLIAEEAKKLNVPMVIVSNARFVDEEFLTRYKALGHILVISVDSVEIEKWNEFRGKKTLTS
ncbi:MAG: radical SAM protein [Bacteroidetes bacterium]|nr:radical SAM protein [Bacteroidota bacterium]